MLRKDWIMRMTEQVAQVIAKMLFHKDLRQYRECHRLTDEALRQFFTLNRALLLSLSADDCLQLAGGFGPVRPEVVLPLVDLLMADADASTMEGRCDEATVLYEKSLAFLDRLPRSLEGEWQQSIESRRALIDSRLSPA